MGGTSTDVSRYAGSYEHVYESTTAGVTIQSAQVHISRALFLTPSFIITNLKIVQNIKLFLTQNK